MTDSTVQTAREYLYKKGLAGRKGRFSGPAKAALQGYIDGGGELSDWDKNGPIKEKETGPAKQVIAASARKGQKIPPKPKPAVIEKPKSRVEKPLVKAAKVAEPVNYLREENIIRVIDRFGTTINVETCEKNHSIRRCPCKDIRPANWLVQIAESYELAKKEV